MKKLTNKILWIAAIAVVIINLVLIFTAVNYFF